MSTSTRTDIHRPSAPEFDPGAYHCMGVWDMNPEFPNPVVVQFRMQVVNHLIDQGYHAGPGSSHQCGHCGTRIRYAALMAHRGVKEWIWVGETCLDERFTLEAGEFQRLRESARLNRERATRVEKQTAMVEANPVLAWAFYPDALEECGVFVRDIAERMRHRADLSERQIAAFATAIARDTEWADRRAAREAERLVKVDAGVQVPEGKVTIVGTVVHTKWQYDAYSDTDIPKMLVESEDGWKVYGTIPAAIRAADGLIPNGTKVSFVATVKGKPGDPTFGFASRPTKAAIL